MIIKTQDGNELINTDNCLAIRILSEDGCISVYCEYAYLGPYHRRIGTYKTSERAHEVLNEIFEKFKGYSTMKMNDSEIKVENVYPETTFEMSKD